MLKYIILVLLVACGLFVWWLPTYLGPDDLAGCDSQPVALGTCQGADAIVAVSGGDTNARADEAIALYQRGWAPKLVFSGGALDPTSPSNAQAMKKHAVAAGVPASVITTEETSANTEQNAVNTLNLIRQQNIKRIILVTSAYHQRRASMEFKAIFGSNITIVNHPVATDKQWSNLWWLTPTGWWLALGELTKISFLNINGVL